VAQPYLHQSLWIVSSPLLEASTFRKSSKTCKWRCCCNPVKELWASLQSAWSGLYRQSMSSRIALPGVPGCFRPMYFVIHSTRWSLNVPLMSWCRRSGDISSYMLTWGRSFVNSCRNLWVWHICYLKQADEQETSHVLPQDCQRPHISPICLQVQESL